MTSAMTTTDHQESAVTTFDTPTPIRARVRLHAGGLRVIASFPTAAAS